MSKYQCPALTPKPSLNPKTLSRDHHQTHQITIILTTTKQPLMRACSSSIAMPPFKLELPEVKTFPNKQLVPRKKKRIPQNPEPRNRESKPRQETTSTRFDIDTSPRSHRWRQVHSSTVDIQEASLCIASYQIVGIFFRIETRKTLDSFATHDSKLSFLLDTRSTRGLFTWFNAPSGNGTEDLVCSGTSTKVSRKLGEREATRIPPKTSIWKTVMSPTITFSQR